MEKGGPGAEEKGKAISLGKRRSHLEMLNYLLTGHGLCVNLNHPNHTGCPGEPSEVWFVHRMGLCTVSPWPEGFVSVFRLGHEWLAFLLTLQFSFC